MQAAKKLYLVDGMSHIYRAYHALPGLTSKKGVATNAVYGFTMMIRKLIQEEEPAYLGVAIDLPGPTIRHEKYEDYKATRPPMPDDLAEQIPYILKVCQAFRIPLLSFEKYEADDVIATLARKAASQSLEVVIVTIDKDMFQLVDDKISILDTRTMSRLDPEKVAGKFGVRPEQVVDVLSLVGDASDNIPGAPGIGEKGARQLIQQYGTLDKLLECKEQVSRKSYRESLQKHEDRIRESRELIRIHQNLPLELNLQDLELSEPDLSQAAELFAELGFNTLVKEFLPAQEKESTTCRIVSGESDLDELKGALLDKAAAVSVSFGEGGALHGKIRAMAVCWAPPEAWYVEADTLTNCLPRLESLLSIPQRLVVHDLKPLLVFCLGQGGKPAAELQDTMLMSYLLSPNQNQFGLEQMAAQHLKVRLGKGAEKKTLFDEAPPEQLCERADFTLRLFNHLEASIQEQMLETLLHEIELPLVEVLAKMERDGVKVDTRCLEKMSGELEGKIAELSRSIFEMVGEEFNLNSPKQISSILFEKLKLPSAGKTGKAGHLSTGVEVLENLAEDFEIARLILDYRELTKLKNTYLDALPRLVNPRTGRIHTSYNQMVAATGRLSSSNPNLQNIPIRSDLGRQIRRAFVAEEGFQILAADYSQIELRVMAHLSEDPVLIEAFRKGEDIHSATARQVFGSDSGLSEQEMRRRAKVINFGILYGLSAFGLAQSLKIDRREAQLFIDHYFERYRGVQIWLEKTVNEAEKTGFVTTLFGRRRPIPELKSRNWNLKEFGKRTAVNAPIQGTAADLIKKAMVSLYRAMQNERLKSRMILQVHDELLFEVENSEVDRMKALVKEKMETAAQLKVPLQVDLSVGSSWFEAK